MPTAVKHQREYGEDLQVIFVECQGADRDTYEAFAWKMKWMGNAAMWTDERPFPTVGNGLPETALIGVDGTILVQGNPGMLGKRLTEALEAEVEKVRRAPADTPPELKKAWGHFAKGELAAALAECDKAGGTHSEEAKQQFLARGVAKVERLKRLIDESLLTEATELAQALAKEARGVESLEAPLAEQRARLDDPALAREREAAKAVDGLLEKLAQDKPFDEGSVKKVAALAKKFEGTKAAARAERFVALSKLKVGR